MSKLVAYVASGVIAAALSQTWIVLLLTYWTVGFFFVLMVWVGFIAVFGPLGLLIPPVRRERCLAHAWACALIVYIGFSYGISSASSSSNKTSFYESFTLPISIVGWVIKRMVA